MAQALTYLLTLLNLRRFIFFVFEMMTARMNFTDKRCKTAKLNKLPSLFITIADVQSLCYVLE